MTSHDDSFDDDIAAVTFDEDDGSVAVIVGSGAGGGTLANELAQKGINVVVIEAGPRFKETDFENDEWAMHAKLTWRDKRAATGSSPVAQNFGDAPTWVCKGVGGSTLHWAGMCPRFQDHEFKVRSVYGDIAGANLADWPLSLDEIAPYYDRAEDKMGVAGTNGIPRLPPNNNFKVMAAGARRIGYSQIDTNNVAVNTEPRDGRNACDQISFCHQGCRSGAKWSTMNSEIPKAEATGRCEVRPNAMALRIEQGGDGRVSGVVYADQAGNQRRQRARIVCVAGNSIETPRLLLNSESSAVPDGLANASGQVGKNYMRHMFGFVYAEFDQPVNFHRGQPVAGWIRDEAHNDPTRGFVGGYYTALLALGLPFYAAFLNPMGWGREYTSWIEPYDHIASVGLLGEDMPIETNQVSLHPTERDQFGLPVPNLHLDDHPNELAMRNFAYKRSRELYEAVGAKRVFEAPPLPASHNLGTCRMAGDAARGVVNKWGQSHDIDNLFMSDGSQFTSSMAGNPTLTIVALAIRQAEYIAEQMRRNDL
jgi:choline dehydrogenase-like flavoprotein